MKNIKVCFKFLLFVILPFIVLAIGVIGYLWFDDQMFCLDIGKIYDPVQKICRDDCLTWNEKIGCVPITKENIEKKAKGLL